MDLSLCWTTTPKGVLLVKLIEPPLAEPHERWCERSKIPLKKDFSPTRLEGHKRWGWWLGCCGRLGNYLWRVSDLRFSKCSD